MACARQLFVFSETGDRAHADVLFSALTEYFQDRTHGGFHYSVDAAGRPREVGKDLYTHAFVIFACAAYFQSFQVPAGREIAEQTIGIVRDRFAADPSTGLRHAAMSEDFIEITGDIRQNPLMHLTEAYLMARQSLGDTFIDGLLDDLLMGIARTFVDDETSCIMELPCSSPRNSIEPGHQFEWFFLGNSSAHRAFQRSGLDTVLRAAFDFAQRHGVDPVTGGVAASLDRAGHVQDTTQRIWAQTEYLRALACHPQAERRATLEAQVARFHARFLHADGWHECLSADGVITRDDMPSTTPYHLLSSYIALR